MKKFFTIFAMTFIGFGGYTALQVSEIEAFAKVPEGCNGWCEINECSFGGDMCAVGCYDGETWTFCVQPVQGG